MVAVMVVVVMVMAAMCMKKKLTTRMLFHFVVTFSVLSVPR